MTDFLSQHLFAFKYECGNITIYLGHAGLIDERRILLDRFRIDSGLYNRAAVQHMAILRKLQSRALNCGVVRQVEERRDLICCTLPAAETKRACMTRIEHRVLHRAIEYA